MSARAVIALGLAAWSAPALAQPSSLPPTADDLMVPDYAAAEPSPEPEAPTTAPTARELPHRPRDWSIGIGAGFELPADLERPSATSVRFRLSSAVTLEPVVLLRTQSSSHDDGTTETDSSSSHFELQGQVRYLLRSRGKVDLVLVGGASIAIDGVDGTDGTSVDTTTFSALWGLGLDYWITPHWSISLTAVNPAITYQDVETTIPDVMPFVDEVTSVEASFDPQVFALVHLFL